MALGVEWCGYVTGRLRVGADVEVGVRLGD